MGEAFEKLFQERTKRVQDAIELKVPDRIPVMGSFTFFPAKYAGITFQEVMYDYDKLDLAAEKTILDFQPDMFQNPYGTIAVGPTFEILDYRQLRWPGHGVAPHRTYQFVEDEYMKAEEYDEFLFDPSGFMLGSLFPRIYGALEPLKMLPSIPRCYYLRMVPNIAVLGTPEVAGAFESLLRAGAAAKEAMDRANRFVAKMESLGFPCQFGASVNAPFDYIGDFLRGTRGLMIDLYRNPDKVLEAVEKLLPIMVEAGISMARKSGIPRVFIPLHKGAHGFMSLDQFNRFYWPTLRKLILALIDEGLTPCPLFEGDYTSRLDIIGDIPVGKAIYWFERTDIFKAKAVLGNQVCIRGNVPASLLCTGTPQAVKDYCKKLIDIVGKGGGFIMDGDIGVPDEARAENVRAMIDFTKEYGVYK
ncbi:MAG: uroporphyrinogen decarboxylase family protein [Thermodesulfobacteriota bacterium]